MPLSAQTLRDEILRRTDATRADFAGWPATAQAAAEGWARVASYYFSEIVNPALVPGDEAQAAALEACEAAFVAAAMATADGQGRLTVDALPAGFTAYAAALTGAPGYVLTPPPVPLAWPDPDDPSYPVPTADPNPFANLLSALVDSWARTGTAGIPPASAAWS